MVNIKEILRKNNSVVCEICSTIRFAMAGLRLKQNIKANEVCKVAKNTFD
jgi:hypothetical protein